MAINRRTFQVAIADWQTRNGIRVVENFLSKLVGKKIDLYCGGSSSLRGEVVKVESGILYLKDSENKYCYVAVDKIVVVWEARDDEHRAGFVPTPFNRD
ncbi:MAG: MM0924 family protein [Pyrinomonadaceae bacterium]